MLVSLFLLLFTTILPARTLTDLSIESLTIKGNMDCRQQDSLVLAELYLATNANGWTNPWDLSQPMDTWYGVVLNAEGCVEVLDLDGNTDVNCPECWGGGNNLTDTIPISIWNLAHLKNLSFSGNYPTVLDSIPSFIDDLNLLEVLSLPQLQMAEGSIPSEIGNISNLRVLLLFGNRFTGSIPATIGNLVNLEHLGLQENQLSGSLPTNFNNLINLTSLSISNNQITVIPDLSNLSNLRELYVDSNPLGGTIPNWLGSLTNLEATVWAYCQLEGTIPDFWNGFNNLYALHLYDNNLTGSIPSSLGNTNLRYLALSDNKLTGSIPIELTILSTLQEIDVTNNELDGIIPDLSTSINLQRLAVKENQLTFEDLLPNINAIETLINNNTDPNDDHTKYQYQTQKLVGTPTSYNFIMGQTYTIDLDVDDDVSTNFYRWYKNGVSFASATGVNTLTLDNVVASDIGTYTCEITNPAIPDLTLESHSYRLSVIDPACRMKDSLVLVDLYNATGGPNWTNTWDLNQPITTWYGINLNIDGCVEALDLDGNLDVNCPGCWGGGNNLIGTVPTNFWNLNNLKIISLGGNGNLSMSLLPEIGNLTDLQVLTLNLVDLSGAIPTEIGNLTQLRFFFGGNGLTGNIPSSLNNLVSLESLDLSYNQFISIPDLGNLSKLESLNLIGIPFNIPIPMWLGELNELRYLDLRNSNWTGEIPPNLGNLSKLEFLQLSNNQLTGTIPNNFSNLQELLILELSNNQLEGSIPSTISNLPKINQVRLDNNNFSGQIPSFANTVIRDLQLENNQFTFKDLLPNLAANETVVLNNNGGNTMYDSLRYDPQQKIATPTNLDFTTGDNKLLSLNIDNFITSNVYTWFKGDLPFQTINGNSNLSLSNLSESDAGVYTCKVTNPNAPDLTLESHPFTLSFVDPSCRMRDSLILVDLYNATGGPNWTTTWDLNQPMDTWHGVFLNEFGCVTRLDMDGDVDINFVQGIGNGNNLMNTIPASLWNLSELRSLSLANNGNLSTASFPTALVDLIKLEHLNFTRVKLNGAIPTNIDQLVNLTSLTFRFCDLNGTIPEEIGNMTALTALDLFGNDLIDNIPYSLNYLSELTFLNLGANEFTNLIDLSNLQALSSLILSFNSFGGSIPEWLTNLSELTYLYLDGNQLTGAIPDFWDNFPRLQVLHLGQNQLTGNIPASLMNTDIQVLFLNDNQLGDGSFAVIPDFSTFAPNMRDFEIHNNQFTFEDIVPNFVANQNIITSNSFNQYDKYDYQPQAKVGTATSENFVAGTNYTFDLGIDDTVTTNIYTWFKNGQFFQTINGDNALLLNNVTTENLGTYTCEVTNSIAPDLTLESHPYTLAIIDPDCRMKDSLVLVELYNATGGVNWNNTWDLNQPIDTWYGVALNINGCVSVLDLDGNTSNCLVCWNGNNIIGTLPDTIWNLKNLTHFSLSGNNQLNATLPTRIDELLELEILSFRSMSLSGGIPSEIGNLAQLKHLYLNNSGLSGAIPATINNLANLEILLLTYNSFTSLPDLGNLNQLTSLSLSGNYFGGPIPNWIGTLENLQSLSLGNNGWTGTIPANIGNLTQLTFMTLVSNQLEGSIPNNFSNLNLNTLDLGNNQLSGTVPDFIGEMTLLQRLTLSNNNFSGLIPDFEMTQIYRLDINGNALTFKDMLPNIASIETLIIDNAFSTNDSLLYDPQQKIGETTIIPFVPGNNYSINLNIDNFITSNVYNWYRDGNFYETVNGTSSLAINNASISDVGVYTCQVTNPNAPDLTLESYPYTLRLVDTECRMQDSLVLVDLYMATGGTNWNTTWDLSQSMDTWYGVTLNEDGCVIGLDLDGNANDNYCLGCSYGGNNMIGVIPANFWNLDNLIELSLGENPQLSGILPAAINNLANLTLLSFADANLSGTIPEELGDLILLRYVNLRDNNLVGTIPSALNNLLSLNQLVLSFNQFSSLSDLSELEALITLELSYNPFNSQLPAWIGDLTNLVSLSLRGSRWEGEIPTTFSNLENLQSLYLDFNQLTGDLPANFNNLNLTNLFLDDNQLTGSITSVIGNMDNIFFANLNRNKFTGEVPNFADFAPHIEYLYLEENQLTFKDILPNFAANINLIQNNNSNGQFRYAPQAKIGVTTSFLFNAGDSYTFDLGIDEAITNNVYKWYKNGNLVQTITGNNKLVLSNVTTNDIGGYTCEVTNPDAPDLTLYSATYTLIESIPANDDICDAQFFTIGTSLQGTLVGASSQPNEPTVTGGDCQNNWCDSDLNGSVWYAFMAPLNPYVNIKTTGADTKIALYEGVNCGASNPFENAMLIAANDNVAGQCCGGFINLACLNTGNFYFIQVEQSNPNQGDFEIIVNQMASCELPCDLTLISSDIEPMSCPGSNNAIIRTYVNSPSGHQLVYDVYDDNSQLIKTELSGDIFSLSAGTYTVIARSLDNANCTLDLGDFVISNDVDNNAPEVNCINGIENVAYVRGSDGNPWGVDSYTNEMDSVFATNWQEFTYESVKPQLLFSDAYNFVYLEGNANSIDAFRTFMETNQQLIEDWVALGNSLLINAGSYGNELYDIGFGGVQLSGNVSINEVTATNPNHPIFAGPNLPTATSLTGTSFGHAIVCPPSMNATPLLESPNGDDLLVEATWGNGKVFFGSMTGTAFHYPSEEAFNVKTNMLAYLVGEAIPAANTPIQLAIDENQTSAILTPAMIDAGTFDNCELTSLQLNKTTFDCTELGLQQVVLSATDASGNVGTCATSVMITDPNNYCSDNTADCQNEWAINDASIKNGTYAAATTITSTGTILEDTTVVFKAGQTITLQAGFHAQVGSEFTAIIEDCTPNNTLEEVAIARTQSIETTVISTPTELKLKAYPNPFNETATVDYYLPTAGQSTIQLMDFMGKAVQLISPMQETAAGWHQVQLNAADLATGTYFLVLQNEGEVKTVQLILVN